MSNLIAPDICRTIAVKHNGRAVAVENVPKGTIETRKYLRKIWKNNKVEHVGREAMIDLGFHAPSDLFFQAAHNCFSHHYSLTLRPEVLMHLILGEVATTVNRHPDTYRHFFTQSKEGKDKIEVRHDGLVLGDPSSPWMEGLALFRAALKEKVPPGVMEHALPGFSTADLESDAASTVAFMDAAKSFYDYHMYTMCVIPEIRLAGTPEDYRKLMASACALAEVFDRHLGDYFRALLPVIWKISDQANGQDEDQVFWSSIYKHASESGDDRFNGWLTTFVHYTQDVKGTLIERERHDAWDEEYGGSKLVVNSISPHLSSAPFEWHFRGYKLPMRFVGGVLGMETWGNSVMPRLSYAVIHEN